MIYSMGVLLVESQVDSYEIGALPLWPCHIDYGLALFAYSNPRRSDLG